MWFFPPINSYLIAHVTLRFCILRLSVDMISRYVVLISRYRIKYSTTLPTGSATRLALGPAWETMSNSIPPVTKN